MFAWHCVRMDRHRLLKSYFSCECRVWHDHPVSDHKLPPILVRVSWRRSSACLDVHHRRMHQGVRPKLRIMTRCDTSRATLTTQQTPAAWPLLPPSVVCPPKPPGCQAASSGAESGWTQSWRTVVDWEPKPPGCQAASSGAESGWTQSWRTVVDWEPKPPGCQAASSGAESGWTQSWRTVVDWEPKPPGCQAASSSAESGWTRSWRTVVDWEPKPPGCQAASSGAESCCTRSWKTAAGREQPHKHWCLQMQQGCSDQQIA